MKPPASSSASAPPSLWTKSRSAGRPSQSAVEKRIPDAFIVGIIRGTHGLSGELKVESTSGVYEHFEEMGEVSLMRSDFVGIPKKVRVEYMRCGASMIYIKLAGVDTAREAAKYIGCSISVPREKAHALKENEWYIEDLKGCEVWYKADDTSASIGTVQDVVEGGGSYLLEIRKNDGGVVFVPFDKKFIGEVNVERGKIQLLCLWILE